MVTKYSDIISLREQKAAYNIENDQDRRIFALLKKFSEKELTEEEEEIIKFLYSQLEKDWRTPLEQMANQLYLEL